MGRWQLKNQKILGRQVCLYTLCIHKVPYYLLLIIILIVRKILKFQKIIIVVVNPKINDSY